MTPTLFFSVLRCELRRLNRDPACWLTLAIFALLAAYAVWNGQCLIQERAQTIAAAHADASQRLQALKTQLAKIEAGTLAAPEKPWRDPRNPLSVGNQAATAVALSSSPLALISAGVTDLYPPAFKVGVGSPDTFLFADEITNPLHVVTSRFDLAFVLTAILPLCIIVLCFNVISSEREQGTLALTLACPVSAKCVFMIKLALRALLPVALALTMTLASVRVLAGPLPLTVFAWLSAAIILYSLFWAALAIGISSLGRDSAFNALALFTAWAAFLLIIPALLNAAAQLIYPLPPRSELVLAARTAAIGVERECEAEQARYRAEHGMTTPADFSRENANRRVQIQLATQARVEAILLRQDAASQQQQQLTTRLAVLSPAMLAQELFADLAGSSPARIARQIDRIKTFHRQWRAFFLDRAAQGKVLRLADYADFPSYPPSPATEQTHPASHTLPWWLMLLAVTLTAWLANRAWRQHGALLIQSCR